MLVRAELFADPLPLTPYYPTHPPLWTIIYTFG